jgi:hypothetical protein
MKRKNVIVEVGERKVESQSAEQVQLVNHDDILPDPQSCRTLPSRAFLSICKHVTHLTGWSRHNSVIHGAVTCRRLVSQTLREEHV